jgi:hypothetical protein
LILAAFSMGSALAADDTENAGIVAALGLSAADGKTTLAAGAGKIEAELLSTDAVNLAGATIAGLVNRTLELKNNPGAQVIALLKDEPLDVSAVESVRANLAYLIIKMPDPDKGCALRVAPDPKAPGLTFESLFPKVALKDLPAAVATSTSVAAIETSVGERLLLAAVAINSHAVIKIGTDREDAVDWARPDFASATSPRAFSIPSDAQVDLSKSEIWGQYAQLVRANSDYERCKDSAADNGLWEQYSSYIKYLNAVPEKSTTSNLMAAIRLEAVFPKVSLIEHLRADAAKELPRPAWLQLRLFIENTGGTSFAKSSIWYTLGFPGAATVSSGLVVSFRLVEPSGNPILSGIVRCAEKPRNMRSVARNMRPIISSKEGCAYVATPIDDPSQSKLASTPPTS